jgi:hypothetical protein
MASRRHSRCD